MAFEERMAPSVALLIWFLVAAGPLRLSAHAPTSSLTAPELQVIVAALEDTALREARRVAVSDARERPIAVVAGSTLANCTQSDQEACIHPSTQSTIARLLSGAESSLAREFVERNAVSADVPRFGERIAFVPPADIDTVLRPVNGWEEFHRRFGRVGVVRFSAPAIVGDRGAVLVVFVCGGLCGKSWLVTLEREGGKFRVRKSEILTVS